MENEMEKNISEVTKVFFQKAGFVFDELSVDKTEGPENQDIFLVRMKSNDDCSLILGHRGNNLKAAEHLIRVLLSKKINQKINLVLDLNNFREKRNDKISELARLAARKVQATSKAYVLSPMSAYERRLVHMELATWSDISTESIGEEPRRRVVIKPHP